MIILMGVAGAGKSTQGRMLSDEFGFAWISTGEILRVLVTGKRRQEMLSGQLLNDNEMINLMDKVFELVDTSEQCILDGFPRTMQQASWLIDQGEKSRFTIDLVVNLLASEEVIRSRLAARGRPDDSMEAISLRLEEYEHTTKPILGLFKQEHIPVVDIIGDQDSQTVHGNLLNYARQLKLV